MGSANERHGCLTTWLMLIIIVNALTAVAMPLMVGMIQQTVPDFPVWVVWPMAVLALLNVLFAVALLNWQKWGFYGFVVNSLIAFGLNLYAGTGVPQSLFGLVGIAVLYAVLQIGGPRSGWAQMSRAGRAARRTYQPRTLAVNATQCSICGAALRGREQQVGLCRRCEERAG